jgi:hypothetical protein
LKKEETKAEGEHGQEEPKQEEPWDETFKGHIDSKPFGALNLLIDWLIDCSFSCSVGQ